VWRLATGNQVQMIGHDRIGVYLKSLVLLAIPPTVEYYVPVGLPTEQIHPAHDRAGQVVESVLVAYFVFDAHNRLIISLYVFWHCWRGVPTSRPLSFGFYPLFCVCRLESDRYAVRGWNRAPAIAIFVWLLWLMLATSRQQVL